MSQQLCTLHSCAPPDIMHCKHVATCHAVPVKCWPEPLPTPASLQLLESCAALSSVVFSGMRHLSAGAWPTSCECMTGAMCAPFSTCVLVYLTSQQWLVTWMATQPSPMGPTRQPWWLLEASAMQLIKWSKERSVHCLSQICLCDDQRYQHWLGIEVRCMSTAETKDVLIHWSSQS